MSTEHILHLHSSDLYPFYGTDQYLIFVITEQFGFFWSYRPRIPSRQKHSFLHPEYAAYIKKKVINKLRLMRRGSSDGLMYTYMHNGAVSG